MQTLNTGDPVPEGSTSHFKIGQRVHSSADTRRIGTVKYVGPVEGYSATWVGVDWDNDADGKHDGSLVGARYFLSRGPKTGSFCRPQNLSSGITLLQALQIRYQSTSTKEEEDEMYVLSAGNRRVAVELLGKDKVQDKLSKLDELTSVSLSCLGVSSPGTSSCISENIPNLKELDLTGNLLSDWKVCHVIGCCHNLQRVTSPCCSQSVLQFDVLRNYRDAPTKEH